MVPSGVFLIGTLCIDSLWRWCQSGFGVETKLLKRNPDVVCRNIDQEMILVPVRSTVVDLQCLFTLNETGAFIWEILKEPKFETEIVEKVTEEFKVEQKQAQKDVDLFLKAMIDEGCLLESS